VQLKDRIVGFERLDPSLIRPNPRNWRTHPQGQRDALRGVLADVGIVDAVLVRKMADGTYLLVDGHLRAEEITGQPVPALILDLDEREEAEVLATFDPVGDMAGKDSDVLASLLGDFNSTNAAVQALCSRLYQPVNVALDDAAFRAEMDEGEQERPDRDEEQPLATGAKPNASDDAEPYDAEARKAVLKASLADAEDGPSVNPTDELRAKWKTESGQLWVIKSATGDGEHRLLCGDSTSAADVSRLMAGQKAAILQTDAPYGVDYSKTKTGIPRSGFVDHGERWGDIANDELQGDGLCAFLTAALRAAEPHIDDDAAFYMWHPSLEASEQFRAAMEALGLLIHRQIIWKKPGFVLTRSGMYHWAHEPCFYGWKRGSQPPWYGDKSQTSVWECGRDSDSGMHPTQKPVELFVRPLNNHTKPGDVCYEPFSGSGSQLLAAEQMGRICHAMEMEPKYVAVALERLSARGLRPELSA